MSDWILIGPGPIQSGSDDPIFFIKVFFEPEEAKYILFNTYHAALISPTKAIWYHWNRMKTFNNLGIKLGPTCKHLFRDNTILRFSWPIIHNTF